MIITRMSFGLFFLHINVFFHFDKHPDGKKRPNILKKTVFDNAPCKI